MAYKGLILTSNADYSMIRSLLGVDSTQVTDLTIEDYGFLPLVEAEVTDIVTTYATILAAVAKGNAYRLKTGVAAWVAALLCQHIEREEGQAVQIGDYREQATQVDWRAKADTLMEKAAGALASLSTRTLTRRTALVVNGPTRSKSNVPDDLEEWLERIQPRLLDWIEERGENDW